MPGDLPIVHTVQGQSTIALPWSQRPSVTDQADHEAFDSP